MPRNPPARPAIEPYRTLTSAESSRLTCATCGCDERPCWMRTVRHAGGIGFYPVCKECKVRIEQGG